MKLALKCNLGLGDIVVLTAVIRELKQQYSFDLLPIVPIAYNTLLRNSPHFRQDIQFNTRLEYPDVLNCDMMAAGFYSFYQHKKHFVKYALDWFAEKLGLSLETESLHGEIFLTDQEKQQRPIKSEYWVLVAGGKYDATVKFYPHWQTVVDGLNTKIIQIQNPKDYHPKLNGVEFVETRYCRDFAKLIYHSAGVIAPVTSAVHIAGAFQKPCVVVAGGYEPEGWIKYPNHIVLNQFGLPCAMKEACFKKWAFPTEHGPKFQKHQECQQKINIGEMTFAACMNELTPERIIESVKSLS
jgi:ADP-heptose:LPS heptosyltransferase